MSGKLEGRVAFITGAARGQGRSHAIRLAHEGADIVAVDVCRQLEDVEYPMSTEDDLEQTVKLVGEEGRRIVSRVADVRDLDALQAAFDDGVAELGHIDIVLANAGVMPVTPAVADRSGAWQVAIDVMLTGVSNTIRVAVPHLVERGAGGSIVLTGSTAGLAPRLALDMATPGMTGYVAAKHGVVGLMRGYAHALAPHNVRVNVVHPTGVASPMVENEAFFSWVTAHPSVGESMQNKLPDVPVIQPADVTNAIFWLVSDEARYVTGIELPVEAGFRL
jgi:SDR family mycofactocin-dependent oxidoreductase